MSPATPLRQEAAVEAFVEALLDDDAELLYEQAPCGYLSTTPDGTVIKVNQTFLTLTGWTREELVGRKRFVDLLTAGGRIYHETHYAPMLQMQGSAREIALDVVCPDGRRLPALVNAVLERDAEGAPRVIRTAVFDATARREYERELLRAKDRAEASEERATALARTLQQTLIPPVPPTIPGLDVAAAYRPAGAGDEVGGDFYDVFQIARDNWAVVLGDVCGKGADAAVVTALLRFAIRAAAVASPDAQQTLAITNDVLRHHDTDRFCTALLIQLQRDGDAWEVTLSAAGHPLPLLVTRDGDVRWVGEPGSLLGVLPDLDISCTSLTLQPGDRLLMFTDGVTEARRGAEEYGEDRLVERVSGAPGTATDLVDRLLSDVLQFQAGNPRDDIAILAVGPA